VNAKRALDLGVGSLGLVVAAPLLAGVALAMRATGDRGPFLHRAERIGEGGVPFTVLKVRTMRVAPGGPGITTRDDPRVTRIGALLRRFRLDALPQLDNVLRGDWSLVGPRPEDPRYVDFGNPLHRRVFTARPGITGLAQLEFHDEARHLVGGDPEQRYREVVLPAKLAIDARYLDDPSVRRDLVILGRTIGAVLGRGRPDASDPGTGEGPGS
jgi:lipopolysaccharide/colanic/teichoic acid biosynthesis glycosyltransferase